MVELSGHFITSIVIGNGSGLSRLARGGICTSYRTDLSNMLAAV